MDEATLLYRQPRALDPEELDRCFYSTGARQVLLEHLAHKAHTVSLDRLDRSCRQEDRSAGARAPLAVCPRARHLDT